MCVTRFGEKYLNRVFKFSISQIEIFLFHFSVFDILFLPYMSRMAMAYSQIPIFIWFLLQKRNIFNRKDFSAYRIFSYMIIVSTFISIYTIPESLFFNGISENVKRMFQYIMNMSFFFFFIHIFETYIVSIKKYLLGFLLYVAVLGALYLFDFNLFIEIKEYLNPKDALLEILDDSTGYIYRYSFLWSDPNNIGNNNVNVAHLKDCCINRFDIHCYGRDIDFENCTIFRLYNQYSSIYGKISYRNCVFDAAIPCLLTSSYNAYTPFDLFFENCIMKMTSLNDGIIYIMGIPKQENERFELAKKCLPNIKIDNCQIEFKEPLKECYIFKSDTQRLPISFGYISQIVLNKIDISSDAVVCKISNIDLFTDDVIDYKMEKLSTKGSNKISPIVVQSGK